MISIRSAIAVIAATTSGATVKPSCAANRAARSIRSGSSEKESSGRPGVRSSRWARSTTPPYGSSTTRPGQPHRHRVDGEVAAAEVALEGVAEVDGRLARGRVVGLGAVRRHLDGPRPLAAADGAEVAAHVPGRVAPRRRAAARCRRGARRSRSRGRCAAGRASRRGPARRPAPARGRRPRTARRAVVDHRRHPVQLVADGALELDHGERTGLGVRTRGSTLGRGGRSTGLGTHSCEV